MITKTLRSLPRAATLAVLVLACLFIMHQAANAQTGTLAITLRSNPDSTPVANASVVVYQQQEVYSGTTDNNGNVTFTNLLTGVKQTSILPQGYAISQNYPNPFNPNTRFQVTTPNKSHVQLDAYNILGQHITSSVKDVQAGTTFIDAELEGFAEGVYFFRINIDGRYENVIKGLYLRKSQHLSEITVSPNATTTNRETLDRTEHTNSGIGVDSVVVPKGNRTARTVTTNIPVFAGTYHLNINVDSTYFIILKPYTAHLWEDTIADRIQGATIVISGDTLVTGTDGKATTTIPKGIQQININAPGYWERNTAIKLPDDITGNNVTTKGISLINNQWFTVAAMNKFNKQFRNRTDRRLNGRDTDSTDNEITYIDTSNIYKFKNTPQVIIDTIASILRNQLPIPPTPVHPQGAYNIINITIGGTFPYHAPQDYPKYVNYRLIQFGLETGGGFAETGIDWSNENTNRTIYSWTVFDSSMAQYVHSPSDIVGVIQSGVVHECIDLGDGGIETNPDSIGSSLEVPAAHIFLTPFDMKVRFIKDIRWIGNFYIPGGCQDNDVGLDREPDNTTR